MLSSGLDHPTLVLNRNWQPIDAVTAREALVHAVADKAKIICPDTYMLFDMEEWMEMDVPEGSLGIQTVRQPIRIPEVIVNEYAQVPKRVVVFSRRNLWRRDGWRCQYCGIRPAPDEITVDHILPRSRGGLTSFENCVLACVSCNKRKDDRLPEEAGMSLRKTMFAKDGTLKTVPYHRPKRPGWSPIFAVRRQKLPESWGKFVQHMIDDLYWNRELEE